MSTSGTDPIADPGGPPLLIVLNGPPGIGRSTVAMS
jgi:hypothetical protein